MNLINQLTMSSREIAELTGEKNGHAYNECKFTPKGVAWVSEQWKKEQEQ